jgi:hypothetical protein
MKKKISLFAATCLTIILLSATVYAAPAEVPRTGQTTAYSSGDAGNLQTGVAWPNPRFTAASNVVADNLTGLIWPEDGGTPTVASCTGGGNKTWQGALDYVACLNASNYLGYNDWRLPDVNELESMVNDGQSNVATWLNTQGFKNVQANFYWSSSTYVNYNYTGYAWFVDMYSGYTSLDFKEIGYFYVWPVRGGQCGSFGSSTICLPKTGQATVYATGDDGNLQKGIAWPSPRFTPISAVSGTVVADQLTGLVWTRDANAPGPGACGPATTKIWQGALDYVACLNTNNYLGYNDWRLPNRKELRSLANYGNSNVATWLNTQGFINVQADVYWSSSTYASSPSHAWLVLPGDGDMRIASKVDGSYYVWPVRAGQSASFANLTITKSGTSSGSVTLDKGALIWSGSIGTASFGTAGTAMIVNLTATPDSGMVFTGWSGACTGTGACQVLMSQARNVTAIFTFDTTPNQFTFTGQSNITLNTPVISNSITLSGINTASPISITGGTYSINNGEFTSEAGTVSNGDSVRVQLTSAIAYSTLTSATLNIGGVNGTFNVTTAPDLFNFTSPSNVALNTVIISNTITVSVISTPASISITGGSYSINNGAFSSEAGTVNNGDSVRVQVTSANAYSTMTSATLNIGRVNRTFNVTTVRLGVAPAALPRTGQTTAYYPGDAGNLQTGVAWPNPRFTVASSGTGIAVTDNLTGLIWPQDAGTPVVGSCTGGMKTWQGALDYVACLNTNNYLGNNDWRLPNVIELISIATNDSQPNTSVWLTTQGFTNVQGYDYWSRKTYWSSSSSDTIQFGEFVHAAWVVGMGDGQAIWNGATTDSNVFNVWPVRGGENGATNLPKTGQKRIYSAGDDGSLQKGYAWPSPRFTPISAVSGTMEADQLTGLVWTLDANAPGPAVCGPAENKTWQGALDYVACLNTNKYLGYNDWRLPNKQELRSLVNYGEPDIFSGAITYWSSSTSASDPTVAWYFYTNTGVVGKNSKTIAYNVRPVRDQSGPFAYLSIAKSGTGTGMVTADNSTLDWLGSTGTASYGTAMTVNLTAAADSGMVFTGWSGACTGADAYACQVNMSQSRNLTATFDLIDTIPDTFTFSDKSTAALNIPITSYAITVSGINSASPISITGGAYSINDEDFISDTGTVKNGDSVRLQLTSSNAYSAMKSATLNIGGVNGTFTVTTVILIAAPAALPRTGQTTVYYPGDDGSVQAGVAWPNPRFTAASSGTGIAVTDNLTGLIWPQDAVMPATDCPVFLCGGETKTWQEALNYVPWLNSANYLGHNDWRLPNVNELESLGRVK